MLFLNCIAFIATMATNRTQHSHLLDLPPELRNRIYREVLLKTDSIQVTGQGYERPSLLTTCRQIRSEGLSIFYHENSFSILMSDYDISVWHKWIRRGAELPDSIFKDRRVRAEIMVASTAPNWSNLLSWLRVYHEVKGCPGMRRPAELSEVRSRTTEILVTAGMFVSVAHLDSLPWARVKELLEHQRPVLVSCAMGWGPTE